MKQLGENIRRFRKTRKMTQEALASQLNVTSQAVSKWERGEGLPDISMLPSLCSALGTSADILMGYVPDFAPDTVYEAIYQTSENYWGTEPSELCFRILKDYPPFKHKKLLEIGCGEGRDSIFFAKNGYDVTAYDIAQSGIEKVYRKADRVHVPIHAFVSDMRTFRPTEPFDIIYASRSLHYLTPQFRPDFISFYKNLTKPGGIHVFDIFIEKPFIPTSPDREENVALWSTGEIFTYYCDWIIDYMEETIVNCKSSGIPHRHACDLIIARKPVN